MSATVASAMAAVDELLGRPTLVGRSSDLLLIEFLDRPISMCRKDLISAAVLFCQAFASADRAAAAYTRCSVMCDTTSKYRDIFPPLR